MLFFLLSSSWWIYVSYQCVKGFPFSSGPQAAACACPLLAAWFRRGKKGLAHPEPVSCRDGDPNWIHTRAFTGCSACQIFPVMD